MRAQEFPVSRQELFQEFGTAYDKLLKPGRMPLSAMFGHDVQAGAPTQALVGSSVQKSLTSPGVSAPARFAESGLAKYLKTSLDRSSQSR